MRLIVKRTRVGYVYPAVHNASAGNQTDPTIPAMGQRLRLKSSFVLPATWTKKEIAILTARKKYGVIIADNGGSFSISVCPDNRFTDGCFEHLSTIDISNFEVIQTTGANEGPRSTGVPTTDAGPDLTLPFGSVATLSGSRSGVGTVQWKSLAGPGTVVFSAPSQVATTVTFSQPGHYVLALIVSDDVHAVAYDPIAIDVRLSASAIRDGADLLLEFPPLAGRLYQVEYSTTLAAPWTALVDNLPGTGAVRQVRDAGALNSGRRFYRVQVLP